ncbi:hypothetical protein D3C75_973910 [compost metagenome]
MLLFEVNDAVVTDLTTAIEQSPLGIKDRWLVGTGVQAGDRQQHLYVRGKTGIAGCQDHTLTVQTPGQLTDQQLIDVRRQATSPTAISRCGQAAIGLALQ